MKMEIAILLYEGFTALDAIGPYEVLASLPDAEVHFVAQEVGPVRTDTGRLSVLATASLRDVTHPDVIVIPGGAGTMAAAQNKLVQEWVRTAHQTSRWTTSVCTGAFILGAAGLLTGLEATTHWASGPYLKQYTGADYVAERWVQRGKVVTAAGVSAGIDMTLFLAGEIAGQATAEAIQLALEYYPHPPFDGGSGAASLATTQTVELARQLLEQRSAKAPQVS